MPHTSVPANISTVGLKYETTKGTAISGEYRQMLVSNFTSNDVKDQAGYSVVAGYKGRYGKNQSGSHQEIGFTINAGSSATDQASLLDIMYLLMDADTVTGSNPYTHTFSQAGATVAKPSVTLFHNDGRSNFRDFPGFVIDTASISIDKENGAIPIEVSGLAFKEEDTTTKTLSLASNYNVYSPNTAKITIGGTTVCNFKTATIEVGCETEAHRTLCDTAYPSDIDGKALNLSVTLEGDWNEAAGSLSDTIRTAWLNGTTQTSALVISFGDSATNDYWTLTIPRWEIESNANKDLEPDALLPQTMTIYPVWEGDIATNGWSIAVLNTISSNTASL